MVSSMYLVELDGTILLLTRWLTTDVNPQSMARKAHALPIKVPETNMPYRKQGLLTIKFKIFSNKYSNFRMNNLISFPVSFDLE